MNILALRHHNVAQLTEGLRRRQHRGSRIAIPEVQGRPCDAPGRKCTIERQFNGAPTVMLKANSKKRRFTV